MAFGKPLATHYDFGKADVDPVARQRLARNRRQQPAQRQHQWASRRREGQALAPLRVESGFSTTGTAADHRFRTKSRRSPGVAFALAKQLGIGARQRPAGRARLARRGEVHRQERQEVAQVGRRRTCRRRPARASSSRARPSRPAVHAVVHAINEKLGNFTSAGGKTVTHTALPDGVAGNAVARCRSSPRRSRTARSTRWSSSAPTRCSTRPPTSSSASC